MSVFLCVFVCALFVYCVFCVFFVFSVFFRSFMYVFVCAFCELWCVCVWLLCFCVFVFVCVCVCVCLCVHVCMCNPRLQGFVKLNTGISRPELIGMPDRLQGFSNLS